MKKSLIVLAVLASACALYAQEGTSAQEVLAFFTQYNPSVLQKAQHDPAYNEILQQVVYSTRLDGSMETRLEMIALVRNFDSSVKIAELEQSYQDALLLAVTNDLPTDVISQKYREELRDTYARMWAVSVNMQEELVSQYKKILKDLKKNTDLTAEQRAGQQEIIKQRKANSEAYLKQIKENAGQYIMSAVDASMLGAERNVYRELSAVAEAKALVQAAEQARASENLQVKNKNKKPVAK